MTRRETRLTNVLRSRGIGFILALTGAWMVLHYPGQEPVASDYMRPWMSLAAVRIANIAGLVLTAVALIALNRTYNLLKTLSVFFAAYFIFTTCATPGVLDRLGTGVPMALIVVLDIWLLFSVYNTRVSDRRIFLIFALLSAGALFELKMLFFVPVFMVGLIQMKILRVKKIVAAVVGLVTPVWIVWGLDLMPLPSVPRIFYTPPHMVLDIPGGAPFIFTVGVTLVVGCIAGIVSLLRILGFNARARAFNAFIAILGIFTSVLALVNFTSVYTYVPLLNACVAFQVGHFFRATASRRGYIAVLLLLGSYFALYSWTLALSR